MSAEFETAYRQRYGEMPGFEPPPENNILLQQLRHRSHRDFTDTPVADELMQSLFAAAFSAPSKSDLQQVSVIRIKDDDLRARMVAANPLISRLAGAPEFMIWCGDHRRLRRLSEKRGIEFANHHLDAFMNAAVDAGIVMQNFIVAAESVGLGCCPVSQVRDAVDSLSELLELPPLVFPLAGLAVGWPAQAGHISMRLPNRVTVHEDRYDDSEMLDEVAEYDQRREAVYPTPDDAQLHVEQFGVCEDYGWAEKHARQYALPMRTDFGRYIRKQAFDLS